MFQTYENAKINLPWSMPDEFVWSYAELVNIKPWLYADCKINYEESSLRQIFFLFLPAQLLSISENTDVEIEGLYLISPQTTGETDTWRMNSIIKIMIGTYNDYGENIEVTIYELANGEQVFSRPEIIDPKEIINLQIIYKKK